jgi:pyridinium-3,5-bisthiocarboxylic acid mononucleotide nickel chelatase
VTRAAWIDASSGAAGDMILAALIDAGADVAAVESALAGLSSAAGEQVRLRLADVRRHGLAATHALIETSPSTAERGLSAVLALLEAASLPGPVLGFAASVFRLLAAAESKVHGIDPDEVRFHEIGALDSLADVVGSATALHSLGLLDASAAISVSTIGLGSGSVWTQHGVLPVPVPAVVRLLADAGVTASAGPGGGELCTPTGAALLVAMAANFGPMPPMTVRSTGSGAGRKDMPGHANILRVLTGDQAETPQPWRVSALRLVEATVDDIDPRLWPDALAALQAAGAIDCWLTAVQMRNGRPGHVVSALAAPDTARSVARALLRETTSLGLRITDVERIALPRDSVQVDVAGHAVGVKRGFLDGVPVTVQPEFADARAAAASAGLPLAEVIDRAREAARTAAAQGAAEQRG